MISGRIEGTTRVIGKSQGYLGLPLRDVLIDCSVNGPETPAMETAWFPTPAELEAVAAGAPVILRIIGSSHPPVMLFTGDKPGDAAIASLTRDEFVERFVARMLKVAGPKFGDGASVEEYARSTAPSYFEEQHKRDDESPEECADADMSYWGED